MQSELKPRQRAVRHGPARAKSGDPARENFFNLFVRSYRLAAKQGKGLAVYRSSTDLVHRLCGERWAQHTIFPAETALVKRFLAETALQATDPHAIVQHSLLANSWAATWTDDLQRLGRDDFASLCEVSGAEALRTARAAGQGIMLAHSHTLFAPLFWTWLGHEGIAPGVTIWEWTKTKRPEAAGDPRTRALEGARELKSAMDTLRQGGLAHIMADGYQGSRKLTVSFCNRQRGFERTFADLALSADAVVLTVDARFSTDGRVSIDIGAPLTAGPAGNDRAAQSESLVRHYVEHLYQQWRNHPADLSWFQMHRHLRLPPLVAG